MFREISLAAAMVRFAMAGILDLVKVLVDAVMPTAAMVFPKAFLMGAAMQRAPSTYSSLSKA